MINLKLALRHLLKTPFVTSVAIASVALGIGANATIFSLFDRFLLRALPVPEPARLVNLGAPGPKPGSSSCTQAGDCDQVFSYPMFRDLERAQTVFTGIAAHRLFDANLSFNGHTLNGAGLLVSGSYFPFLPCSPRSDASSGRSTTAPSANRPSSCSAMRTGRRASLPARTSSARGWS